MNLRGSIDFVACRLPVDRAGEYDIEEAGSEDVEIPLGNKVYDRSMQYTSEDIKFLRGMINPVLSMGGDARLGMHQVCLRYGSL